jgi:hypothetical protein|nr:MAG TPA: dimeris T4 recombination endonuclease VII [Caudoviricetes sp.]
MLTARKGNRIIKIDDTERTTVLDAGYDIVELDEGNKAYKVVQQATGGKNYTAKEYNELKAERDALAAKVAELEEANTPDREAIKAALTEKGIDFAANAKTEKLIELLEEAK